MKSLWNPKLRDWPSNGAFSGMAGWTPSIASQWQTTAVSSGAFGKGASITYHSNIHIEKKSSLVISIKREIYIISNSLHL